MEVKHGSEGKSDRSFTKKERFVVRAMCGVQLKDRTRSTDLMFILALSETIDQLAMANGVRWYGHVLRRENGHVLRIIF